MPAEILGGVDKGPVNRIGLDPEEPPTITGDDDEAGLPSPATPADVLHIAKLYEESKVYMQSAKKKLQTCGYFVTFYDQLTTPSQTDISTLSSIVCNTILR